MKKYITLLPLFFLLLTLPVFGQGTKQSGWTTTTNPAIARFAMESTERWTTNSTLIILEEDLDSDCDDAGHFACAHALMNAGFIRIVGTATCSTSTNSANVAAAINYYYGRTNIPVGYAPDNTGRAPGLHVAYRNYITTNWMPRYNFSPRLTNAVSMYRKILNDYPSNTVKIVTAGQLTGLKNVAISGADSISPLTGYQLLAKAKEIICVASIYPGVTTFSEYNITTDGDSARFICTNGTGLRITWLPCNIGNTNTYNPDPLGAPLSGPEIFLSHPNDSPVRIVFDKSFGPTNNIPFGWSTGRSSWGQLGILYATFGEGEIFRTITGTNYCGDAGTNHFTVSPTGMHKMVLFNGSYTNSWGMNNASNMIVSLQSSKGVLGNGGGSPYYGIEYSTYGDKDSELHAYVWNKSTTGTNSSATLGIIAGSTIAQIIALNETYNSSINYGTVVNSFQVINRSGPIIFKTYGFTDASTALKIDNTYLLTGKRVGLSGYTSTVGDLSVANLSVGNNTTNPGVRSLYVDNYIYANDRLVFMGKENNFIDFRRNEYYPSITNWVLTSYSAIGLERTGTDFAIGATSNSLVIRYVTNSMYFASGAGGFIQATLTSNGNFSANGIINGSNGFAKGEYSGITTQFTTASPITWTIKGGIITGVSY